MTKSNFNIQILLNQLESSLANSIAERQINNPVMIGIHTGGVWVAEQMHHRLKIEETLGVLDISFYRDDFSQVGMSPKVKPSQLPINSLEDRDIILIDDVFYTGRTIRAALNEIFDYGRPRQVLLGVLLERDGRQIPMKPDCVGETITLPPNQRVKLIGPEDLSVHIQTINQAA